MLSASHATPAAGGPGAAGWRPWLVFLPAALFVVYNYVQQIVPGVITADLAAAFHVTAGALSGLAAYFFYAYAALQIPVGLAVDRWGPRRPLLLAVTIAAAGSLAFGWAPAAGPAGLARLAIGAGAAFSFIACLKLVSNWFAPGRFATLAGVTNTAGMLGAAASAPLAAVVGHTGWRGAMYLLGGIGFVLVALVFVFVRDRPAGAAARPDGGQGGAGGVWSALRGIVQSAQAWLNALYATAISLCFVAFGALWGPPFIAKAYGLDNVAAAGVVALLFLGAIAGSLFFGWFSDRLRSRRQPMIGAALGGALALAALLYVPDLPLAAVRVLLALLGFFCSANILSYAVAHDLSPASAGSALGFLNTCYYGGSAAAQPLVGWLLDRRAAGRGASGLDALQPADFRYAFTAILILLGVALLAAVLLKETHVHKED